MEFKSDRWRFLSSTMIFDNQSKTYVVELRLQISTNVQSFFLSAREADALGDELKGRAWEARQRMTATEGQIDPDAKPATQDELNELLGRIEKTKGESKQ